MKENNYLRIKIYVLIFIFSFALGANYPEYETIMVIGIRNIYKETFSLQIFSSYLLLFFGITLLYDIYVLYKNKKKNKKNE
jgi:hypothetical protein